MTSTEPHPDILADRTDDPMGEALLLQAVRDGSTAAFGILYARYRTFAVAVASQTLPHADAALAEDVAEVAFIRVLTALRNGKGPTDTLRSYLGTSVRREAWRAQRRRRRQAEIVDRWAAGEERATEPDPEPLPDGSDGELGSHVLLGEAFRGLSDRWRHVLWLTEVEGRKPAEVAPMLGISAGTASALAYRARHGLIAAYVAAYRRSTRDEDCQAIAERLQAYVAAGAPADGYRDVVAHLEGCRSCREVSRGVDVLGAVLASMAPFGLLTAGWWAQAAGAGAAGLAGTAAVAGTVAAAHGLAGSTGAATTAAATASGGVGVGGAVAAAAAVVVLAGAAWFGVARTGERGETAAPPPAAEGRPAPASVRGAESEAPATTVAETPPTPAGSAPVRAGSPTSTVVATTSPAASTTTMNTTTTASGSVPTTGAPVTTTTAPRGASTTTTVPPVEAPGTLSGRAAKQVADAPDAEAPVSGIDVVAYDDAGRLVGSTTTGSNGTWNLADIPDGRYLVVAVVPAAYRPATGPDPWDGGSTWGIILGQVEVTGQRVDLVDLRLVDR